jgi:hypothetical protein
MHRTQEKRALPATHIPGWRPLPPFSASRRSAVRAGSLQQQLRAERSDQAQAARQQQGGERQKDADALVGQSMTASLP